MMKNLGRNVFSRPVLETPDGKRSSDGVSEPGQLLLAPTRDDLWLCSLAAAIFPMDHLSGGVPPFLSKVRLPASAHKGFLSYLTSAFFRVAPLFGDRVEQRLSLLRQCAPDAPFDDALVVLLLSRFFAKNKTEVFVDGALFVPFEISCLSLLKISSDHQPTLDLPESCTPKLLLHRNGERLFLSFKSDAPYGSCYVGRPEDEPRIGYVRVIRSWLNVALFVPETLTFDSESFSSLSELFIAEQGDKSYAPISSLPASASMPAALAEAFSSAKEKLPVDVVEHWDEIAADGISVPPERLSSVLSAEQVDAHVLGRMALREGKGFVVADETGVGKGRTLASLVLNAILEQRPVLFLSEKRALFSDFWRDLVAVADGKNLPEPLILHPLGKIFSSDGKLLHKAPTSKKMKETLTLPSERLPLLAFTCYSQFNRKTKGNLKVDFATAFLSRAGSLLVLDESHNASGDSSTRLNTLALVAAAGGVVFSSATFAKTGGALSLYAKALPMRRREVSLLEDCFAKEPPSAFGEAISCSLSSAGYLVRREHAFDGVPVSSVLEPVKELLPGLRADAALLSEAILSLFSLAEAVENWRMITFGERSGVWMRMGGVLSRLSRQHLVLSKIPAAAAFAAANRELGRKTVFALESTFESFLKDIQSDDDEEQDETSPPLWPELVSSVARKMIPEGAETDPEIIQALEKTISRCAALPAWPASPIDYLKHELFKRGVSCSEISGRQTRVAFSEGVWRVEPRPPVSREEEARSFNFGDTDCIIVTRAGSTGISLHASPDFADRRPRDMVELEVALNPGERVQFFGRVRRKGQLHEPSFFTLSNGTLYERRHLEAQNRKLLRLSSLTGGKSQEGIVVGDPWTGRIGDMVCREWLGARPSFAAIVGVSPWDDGLSGVADKVLRRIGIIPEDEQERLSELLMQAVSIGTDWEEERMLGGLNGAVFVRRKFACGVEQKERGDFSPALYFSDYLCPPPHTAASSFPSHDPGARSRFLLAMREDASEMRHPSRKKDFDALSTLSSLSPGDGVILSSSDGGASPYVIAGIQPPENNILFLSQWRVWLRPLDSERVILASGSQIAKDAKFSVKKGIGESAKAPRKVFRTVLEGHPALSEWWRQSCRRGQWHKSSPVYGSSRPSVALPFVHGGAHSWADAPFPLFEPEQVVFHIQRYPEQTLYDAPSEAEASVSISSVFGGYRLSLSPSAVRAGLPPFSIDRHLSSSKPVKVGDVWWSSRFVSATKLKFLVSTLRAAGVSFFAHASSRGWHEERLAALLDKN